MAPWLRILTDSFKSLKSSNKDPDLSSAKSHFEKASYEKESLLKWASNHEDLPAILLLPLKQKRVTLLHNITKFQDQILGINGFNALAQPKVWGVGSWQSFLADAGLASSILTTKLPTMDQLLACKAQKNLTKLVGSSSKSVGSLSDQNVPFLVWPNMFPNYSGSNSPKAEELLYFLLGEINRVIPDKEDDHILQLKTTWEPLAQRLWVIAKEWSHTVKLIDPPINDFAEKWLISKAALLGKLGSPSSSNNTQDESEIPHGTTDTRENDYSVSLSPGQKQKKRSKTTKEEIVYSDDSDDKSEDKSGDNSGDKSGDKSEDKPVSHRRPPKRPKSSRSKRSSRDNGPSDSDPSSSSSSSDSSWESDSSSSSPSSSSSDESDAPKKRKAKKRSKKRRKKENFASGALEYLASKEKAKAKRATILSQWTDDSVRLFKLLSAKNWSARRLPKINEFSKTLVSDKKLTRAERLVKMQSRNWPGEIDMSRLTIFLTEGFLADDIIVSPGGFTVFMFTSIEESRKRTKTERIQHLREVFGDGKLTDDTLDYLAQDRLCLPKNRAEAEVMLQMAIRFLDKLTGYRSIAADGYRYGLLLLGDNVRPFARQAEEDDLFITKFLYFLDTTFQRFCENLLKNGTGKDPIGKAYRRGLDKFMRETIDRILNDFVTLGSPPNLPLPSALKVSKGKAANAPHHSSPKAAPRAEARDKWMRANPSPVKDWEIPKGKFFRDIFGKEGVEENKKGFPKLPHHQSGKDTNLCIRYQSLGNCQRGANCPLAHVPSDKIEKSTSDQISARFKEIFDGL